MFAIGLDIGTTSICGVLLNSDTGKLEKVINRKNDTWMEGDSWEKIQNPHIIIQKIKEILGELASEDVISIGVTGQMHGILYFDKDGKAVSPLYTWQDGRGNLSMGDKTYAEHLNSHTGYGNVTHFYNMKNGLVPENAVGYCTIHDYAVMQLTGVKTPVVHVSDAASFGNFDLNTNKFTWTDEMQPEVTSNANIIGKWNDIPVSAAIGDNQASFIGGGCDKNTVLCNVGTGSQVSLVGDGTDVKSGLEIRPLSNGENIIVGSSLCGGRAYALLESFFKQVAVMAGINKDSLYDEMSLEIGKIDKTDLSFETLFCGTRQEPDKRATITELSEANFTPKDMIYACLTGICDELYEMYENSGGKCTRLVGTGNGIRKNEALKKIIENKFGIKMEIPKFSEEAAVGSALFSLVACGKYKNLHEAERIVNYENI